METLYLSGLAFGEHSLFSSEPGEQAQEHCLSPPPTKSAFNYPRTKYCMGGDVKGEVSMGLRLRGRGLLFCKSSHPVGT